ncbi:hypothetical protein [Mycolicibacterium thermoresistibile]
MTNNRNLKVGLACGALVPALAMVGAPAAIADPEPGIERTYTTELSWTPPSCISVDVAQPTGGTHIEHHCNFGDPAPKRIVQVAPPGPAHVGARPSGIWGGSVNCRVIEDATGRVVADVHARFGPYAQTSCLRMDG